MKVPSPSPPHHHLTTYPSPKWSELSRQPTCIALALLGRVPLHRLCGQSSSGEAAGGQHQRRSGSRSGYLAHGKAADGVCCPLLSSRNCSRKHMQSEPETSIVYLTSNLGLWRDSEGAPAAVADLAATGITDCVQMGVEVRFP